MIEGIFETAAYMQNRELSWLKFNERVLLESNRNEMPLLERFKFLSIFTSNLDEFYMIRVGSFIDSILLGNKLSDNKTGMTTIDQLNEIYRATAPLYILLNHAYSNVTSELTDNGLCLMSINELSPAELKAAKNHFMLNVLPMLSPSIIDTKHPFPHIPNKQLHIAVTLEKKKGNTFGLIAVPSETDRLIPLDSNEGTHRFILLEDLILYFADLAFGVYTVAEKHIIAVTRNADIGTVEELLDEDIDFRQFMKSLLRKRQRMAPVRLEMASQASSGMLEFLCKKLGLKTPQVFYSKAPFDLSFVFSLSRHFSKETVEHLFWPTHSPAMSLPATARADMIKHVSSKDVLLSFPFESMTPFLSLIRQAAQDSSVLSIKITLYRLDAQSKLAESLILAAENGKEVIVLMELRARFDESNNIEWANRFEEAGCRVIYGLVGYKCHSKLCLITRKDAGKLQYITQVGTGNYNEKTAKLYTDLSLITANQEIGRDAAAFFSNMLIENLDGEYSHLLVAPNSFKNSILELIEIERYKAINGEPGRIMIKCNSLTDKEIIEALVRAGSDGVEISMNIRGICCLVPHLPSVTDNIHIISIVGKFLEHTRIFCFGEGDDQKLYIASADFMTRNTQRRVEVACPILDPDVKKRILWMLDVMFKDDTNSWELCSDGRYILRPTNDFRNPQNSQEIFTLEAQKKAAALDEEISGVKRNTNSMNPFKRFLRYIFPR
ncbi:MAG: polyphosphate kinase 1 [Oscillospiraceae bacterium]|nr:polyphosphate kinase 1 [Oscillospiraceae bacterium]MCL2278457.1 polyphosphate kinase 1 [Oscillospiraceae bacterium]